MVFVDRLAASLTDSPTASRCCLAKGGEAAVQTPETDGQQGLPPARQGADGC
ncbi:MAG: hypothetical protein RLZZ206_2896 [Cyanobacteriota bacterium]|jgi:hypothetical protein